MLRLAVRAVFATEAADLSLLHFLFYSHSGGLLDRLLNVQDGAQESPHRRRIPGPGGRAAARLGVGAVCRARSGGSCRTTAGSRFRARARGPRPSGRGRDPAAPRRSVRLRAGAAHRERDQLTQRMPDGSVIKCMAVYDEPFWRADGLTGQATYEIGPGPADVRQLATAGTPGVLLAFVEGVPRPRSSRRRTLERRRRAIVDVPGPGFGPRAARRRRSSSSSTGRPSRWSGGCYGAAPPTGRPHAVRAGAAASRAGGSTGPAPRRATVWAGYMDGAVRSGERVAVEVDQALATSAT